MKSSWALVSKLENEFSEIPSARELVINVREKIEEFKSKMPVIKTLGNPGMQFNSIELDLVTLVRFLFLRLLTEIRPCKDLYHGGVLVCTAVKITGRFFKGDRAPKESEH